MNDFLRRLERLTDLVFAGSLTVMIFLLTPPVKEEIESNDLFRQYLIDSLPRLYLFVITFVIVSIYWVKDLDKLRSLKDVSVAYIWFQLGFLALIMLLPWSNGLVEIRPDLFGPRLFYSINIILIGVFSHLGWRRAHSQKLIKDELGEEYIKVQLRQSLSEPAIALLAICLALIDTLYFDLAFLLIPVAFAVQKTVRQRLEKARMKNEA